MHQTTSPVLFIIFNRPETTAAVFEQIRLAKPLRLYIAADGPRVDHPDDIVLCRQSRQEVETIDWDCELKTLYRDENAGCKYGVSAAISWFFDQEEEGIILEDDCLPANSFFRFCDVMLEKYRDDDRVWHITGCNLQFGQQWGSASYYFSNRCHVWGWASWRRVWQAYDIELSRYNENEVYPLMQNIYGDARVAAAWTTIFKDVKAGTVNSWAYPLDFTVFFNNGLVIIPNVNLVSNIGFTADATNTYQPNNDYDGIPPQELGEITHPDLMVPQKQADLFIINYHFNLAKKKRSGKWWKLKFGK